MCVFLFLCIFVKGKATEEKTNTYNVHEHTFNVDRRHNPCRIGQWWWYVLTLLQYRGLKFSHMYTKYVQKGIYFWQFLSHIDEYAFTINGKNFADDFFFKFNFRLLLFLQCSYMQVRYKLTWYKIFSRKTLKNWDRW